MSTVTEHKAIEAELDNYRKQLDTIPDEVFGLTPPGGGWSYAEVYAHILKATLLSSIAAERCAHGNCERTKKGLTLLGWLVLFFGRFPPVKLKIPEVLATKITPVKIDKEEAKNLIIKCRKRIDSITPLVPGSLDKHKYLHPRMGMLNARQWLKFIRIHLAHHLRQLDRIKLN